jgi:hypothetical protein
MVPPSVYENGTSHRAVPDRVKDAAGAAQRGAGEPILSSVHDDRRAHARSLRSAKLGNRALLGLVIIFEPKSDDLKDY